MGLFDKVKNIFERSKNDENKDDLNSVTPSNDVNNENSTQKPISKMTYEELKSLDPGILDHLEIEDKESVVKIALNHFKEEKKLLYDKYTHGSITSEEYSRENTILSEQIADANEKLNKIVNIMMAKRMASINRQYAEISKERGTNNIKHEISDEGPMLDED